MEPVQDTAQTHKKRIGVNKYSHSLVKIAREQKKSSRSCSDDCSSLERSSGAMTTGASVQHVDDVLAKLSREAAEQVQASANLCQESGWWSELRIAQPSPLFHCHHWS